MAMFGQTEVRDRAIGSSQNIAHLKSAVQVIAMRPPRGNNDIGPIAAFGNDSIVVGTCRSWVLAQFFWVGFAQRKNIHGPETAETQGTSAAFTAFYRRVVLLFGGLGRVEHDEEHAFFARVPDTGQRIAVSLALRVKRRRCGIVFLKRAREQGGSVLRQHKNAAGVKFACLEDANSDGLAFEAGPAFLAVFHIGRDHHSCISIA